MIKKYNNDNLPLKIILECGCEYKHAKGTKAIYIDSKICEKHRSKIEDNREKNLQDIKKQNIEIKIKEKIRNMAIEELKKMDDIPSDYI